MNSFLKTYNLTLTVLSPLFIGSGEELTKKEFIYDPAGKKIFVPDFPKLYRVMKKRGLLDEFEAYMTDFREKDLQAWLNKRGVGRQDYDSFVSYQIDAGEAFGRTDNIIAFNRFMRDPYGLPYIPGSSLKGAVRTALLFAKIKEEPKLAAQKLSELEDLSRRPDKRNPLNKEMGKTAQNLENELLHTLTFAKPGRNPDKRDMVNSLMRGIQISDSAPLKNSDLVLATKTDANISGEIKPLNLCRESLKPGTRVSFSLTLDSGVLKSSGIDLDYIMKALQGFADLQRKQYGKFRAGGLDTTPAEGAELFLGGGAGFWSKTLLYALAEEEARPLRLTAKVLEVNFNKHKHQKDVELGVSPARIKLTRYAGKNYIFGRCALAAERLSF